MPKTIVTNFAELIHRIRLKDISSSEIELSGAAPAGSDVLDLKEALKKNPYLKTLRLISCKLNDTFVVNIAEGINLSGLEELDLQVNKISFVGAEALAKITTLKTLNLSSNRIGDEGISEFIRGLESRSAVASQFVSLNFSNNEITELSAESLTKIVGMNKSLRELRLEGNPNLSEEALDELATTLRSRSLAPAASPAKAGVVTKELMSKAPLVQERP